MSTHHRPVAREHLQNARGMRRVPTDAEKKLWRLLRAAQLDGMKFRRQVPIGPYIADFVCHERRVVIEVDGSQHNEQADQARNLWLNGAGYRVIRFWNNEVLENPNGVLEAILAANSGQVR